MSRINTTVTAITLTVLFITAIAHALPPNPPNDAPGSAIALGGAVPIHVEGTTVLANDDISVTDLPGLETFVDGPDVFYTFTPALSDTYRVMLLPWQRAPLRSSDRRFTIYIQDPAEAFLAGERASGNAQPVSFDVALTAGTTYRIGVDHDASTHDNFDFTLLVDRPDPVAPDDCGGVVSVPAGLPSVVLQDIDGAADDFAFVEGTGRCAVANSTTAPGEDHVYRFTPPSSGDYAVEVATVGFNAVLYVVSACPPSMPADCLGASNSSTSGGGKHELVVVTLQGGVDYYVIVDSHAAASTGGYSLVIDDAQAYEINEVEPNDTFATASPRATPLNGGQLVGPDDTDFWAVNGAAGDRVYAWVNNGGSSNSTLDTDLAFLASDGTTLIEFDDEDADGADAPIEDLRFIYSTSAPVIAGATLLDSGTHYLQVTKQSATGTVHRYRLHTGVIPGDWSPLMEVEPNDTEALADVTGKNYYTGVIDTTDDVDVYAFEAVVGQRIFIAFDGDPERDGTGSDSANDDPKAFHGKLVITDDEGDVLISDISDSNSVQSAPDHPAQAGFFIARTTGTHHVHVSAQSAASQVGPEETYELAIFVDSAPPALVEATDPECAAIPDYGTDTIALTVMDSAGGDTGICSITLADATNLELTGLSFNPGDPVVNFDAGLIAGGMSGFGKLIITDCAGNTSIKILTIDVESPTCNGVAFSPRQRDAGGLPAHVPDNEPLGLETSISIDEAGTVSKVEVTVTVETLDTGDLDLYLVSPMGTQIELVTDRMSSLGTDMLDVTFSDDGTEILPILGGDAPYTGVWLPEEPGGMAVVNGETVMGDWTLRVVDDSSSEGFGATLVRWEIYVEASFSGPESFIGMVGDEAEFDAGIASIELTGDSNLVLSAPDFTPGDTTATYLVELIDSTMNGTGTVVVTDGQDNTCTTPLNLSGLVDASGPVNSGAVTTDRTFRREVQVIVPENGKGETSTINIPDSFTVGEVEVELTVDSENQGRIAAKLTHGGETSVLVNRIGMEERGSSGNTKNSFDILLDDDAPEADDIHEEEALGSVATLGPHQPDGRGDFFGDGISTDDRDAMLFTLANADGFGDWTITVADTRAISSSENIFRRWGLILKNPCGPERYVATAEDVFPGAGICTIAVTGANLEVSADFTPGAESVAYEVDLVDPTLAGAGMVEITDCVGNVTMVPVSLNPASTDVDPPVVTGTLDSMAGEYNGSATDSGPFDTGIASVELLPFSNNLQLDAVVPDPPSGAPAVTFTITRIDPGQNGRGYVRVTDVCGHRSYRLIQFDTLAPILTSSVSRSKRYLGSGLPAPIPDDDSGGVISVLMVTDTDVVDDVDITFNVVHPFDDDIELTLITPAVIPLFADIGSTGNDFIDTTLDDEAAAPIPDSSSEAPFTGSDQPQGGPALFALDGSSAAGAYSLRVVDDKANDVGFFRSWSMTITSSTMPKRHDGRVADDRSYDAGIDTIELLPGSSNIVLDVDPTLGCDDIVRYSVELVNPVNPGIGVVRITDCAGNFVDDMVSILPADTNDDGFVDFEDLLAVLSNWGPCPGCPADINGDGVVDFTDLLAVLSGWTEGSSAPLVGPVTPPSSDPGAGVPEQRSTALGAQEVALDPAGEGRVLYVNDRRMVLRDMGGVLAVVQDFLQTPRGVYEVELTGAMPIEEHDVLVVPGVAYLGGALRVIAAADFHAAPGARHALVVAGSIDGAFDTIELIGLGSTSVDVVIGPERVELVTAAVPGGAAAPRPARAAADLTGDGVVDVRDVVRLLAVWHRPDRRADLDGSGRVDGADLALLLAANRSE